MTIPNRRPLHARDGAIDQARAVALLTRHANASTRDMISDAQMGHALRTGIIPPAVAHHVRIALDEADLMTLTDLVTSGFVRYAGLAKLAERLLDPGHSTRKWLDERNGF